ncbi:MAG: hypothetical protein LBO06_00185 [Bacteroidales bacterium]|jgi:hypothetical protein|nr:hypothetical protein [Bacteroidales bacterium]
MKKVAIPILIILTIAKGYSQEIKQHNFGFGIGANVYPIANSYNVTFDNMDGVLWYQGGGVLNSGSVNFSFIYEYNIGKRISLSSEPTYILTILQFEPDVEYGYDGITSGWSGNYYINQLNIPVICNFKFPLKETTSNFMLGIGASALFNLGNTEAIYESGFGYIDDNGNLIELGTDQYRLKSDVITPYAILRAGYEINSKHKVQIMFQYSFGILKSNWYNFRSNYEGIDYESNFKKFRVSRFDVDLRFFI